MNMDKKLNCQKCSRTASYRNKLGKEYCYECYWNLEENKYSKPKGELFSDNDIYRSCPYCNSGDLCSTRMCIAKCKSCGIIDKLSRGELQGQIYCSECINSVKGELEERKSEERQQKADEIGKKIEKLQEIESENLTVKDYREVKTLQKQLEILIQRVWERSGFQSRNNS